MVAMPGLGAFSLSADRGGGGVSCDANGVFVGDIPLLTRARGSWTIRPLNELNDELTICYRLPVDISTKASALALIANALNRRDLAMAAIAAVQMQFPDPPPLGKAIESDDEIVRRAIELYWSGLLKDWDPAKHPRTGTKPNPGWFAPVRREPKASATSATGPKIPRAGWPLPSVNDAARKVFAEASDIFTRTGRYLFWGLPIVDGIAAFMDAYSPTELNQGEDRLTAQLKAALQPPQTLDELQQEPTENILGYEQHHIVEQNPDNLAKILVEKFGQEVLDDPNNIVWVARLKHENISGYYNSDLFGSGGPTLRELINQHGFEQQREVGLSIMRKFGVLK